MLYVKKNRTYLVFDSPPDERWREEKVEEDEWQGTYLLRWGKRMAEKSVIKNTAMKYT